MIPKDCLGEVSMARGTADLIDSVAVRHISGKYSSLQFKSYAEKREAWQGVGLETAWLDEEPSEDLYFEALTRIGESNGVLYLTCTPMLGMSSIMRMYFQEGIKL
jgi:phage terminase large subunit-like protein